MARAQATMTGYPQAARVIQAPTAAAIPTARTVQPQVQGATFQPGAVMQARTVGTTSPTILSQPRVVTSAAPATVVGARQAKILSSGAIQSGTGTVRPTLVTQGATRVVASNVIASSAPRIVSAARPAACSSNPVPQVAQSAKEKCPYEAYPRLKMEKETAFLEALAACRFADAKDILEDASGVTIDPNCVFTATILDQSETILGKPTGKRSCSIQVTECPRSYQHPGITVAMLAGLEYAVTGNGIYCDPDGIQEWLSLEPEVCEVVALLIQQGADVNATGDEKLDAGSSGDPKVDGKTPLCAAVQRGSPTLVKMLLDAKADPNHTVDLGGSDWGPGPGAQLPDAFLNNIRNGIMGERSPEDPRSKYAATILELLKASRAAA